MSPTDFPPLAFGRMLVNDVAEVACDVAMLCDIDRTRGRKRHRRICKKLNEGRCKVVGNRSPTAPLNFADLRLVMMSDLRVLLDELESV